MIKQRWTSLRLQAKWYSNSSQCSTLVRKTVCCKNHSSSLWEMVNFDPLGSRNCWTDWDETWHRWLRRWPHPTCTKRKVYVKGVVWAWGEMFNPSVLFWLPERTSSLPGKDWLGALCTQKRVLVVSWFLWGEIPPKSNVPILWGKTPFQC